MIARVHPALAGGPSLVHVDAYRLDDAMVLDDLDIDFAHSVVVVEWGRGKVDQFVDSWLDIEIERPEGVAVAEGDDDLVEPRIVRILPHGPAWEN